MSKEPTIPLAALALLQRFLETGAAGTLMLDVKDGKVIGWRLRESRRLDRAPKYSLR